VFVRTYRLVLQAIWQGFLFGAMSLLDSSKGTELRRPQETTERSLCEALIRAVAQLMKPFSAVAGTTTSATLALAPTDATETDFHSFISYWHYQFATDCAAAAEAVDLAGAQPPNNNPSSQQKKEAAGRMRSIVPTYDGSSSSGSGGSGSGSGSGSSSSSSASHLPAMLYDGSSSESLLCLQVMSHIATCSLLAVLFSFLLFSCRCSLVVVLLSFFSCRCSLLVVLLSLFSCRCSLVVVLFSFLSFLLLLLSFLSSASSSFFLLFSKLEPFLRMLKLHKRK
jgi:hypothetical protein